MIYLLFIVGFVLLVFSADWLVDGASALASRFKVPPIVIGLTVVAFGTSAPEFVVSLMSALDGNSALSITNVLGSNSLNVLVILGVSSIIYPLQCAKNTLRYEIPLSVFAAITVLLLGSEFFGFLDVKFLGLSRWDGIFMLFIFCFFMVYTIYQGLNIKSEHNEDIVLMKGRKMAILIIVGLGGLILGGKLIVDNAIIIANSWGVPQSIIGVTIVALGTSLPELATSAVAAFKKQSDLAIGNVVGSNIFNVFLILGISSIVSPLHNYENLIFDATFATFASVLLLLFVGVNKKHTVTRWHGIAFLLCYIVYVVCLLL